MPSDSDRTDRSPVEQAADYLRERLIRSGRELAESEARLLLLEKGFPDLNDIRNRVVARLKRGEQPVVFEGGYFRRAASTSESAPSELDLGGLLNKWVEETNDDERDRVALAIRDAIEQRTCDSGLLAVATALGVATGKPDWEHVALGELSKTLRTRVIDAAETAGETACLVSWHVFGKRPDPSLVAALRRVPEDSRGRAVAELAERLTLETDERKLLTAARARRLVELNESPDDELRVKFLQLAYEIAGDSGNGLSVDPQTFGEVVAHGLNGRADVGSRVADYLHAAGSQRHQLLLSLAARLPLEPGSPRLAVLRNLVIAGQEALLLKASAWGKPRFEELAVIASDEVLGGFLERQPETAQLLVRGAMRPPLSAVLQFASAAPTLASFVPQDLLERWALSDEASSVVARRIAQFFVAERRQEIQNQLDEMRTAIEAREAAASEQVRIERDARSALEVQLRLTEEDLRGSQLAKMDILESQRRQARIDAVREIVRLLEDFRAALPLADRGATALHDVLTSAGRRLEDFGVRSVGEPGGTANQDPAFFDSDASDGILSREVVSPAYVIEIDNKVVVLRRGMLR